MANGKTSAKVKGAINLGTKQQSKDKWRKNSPVAQKFAKIQSGEEIRAITQNWQQTSDEKLYKLINFLNIFRLSRIRWYE